MFPKGKSDWPNKCSWTFKYYENWELNNGFEKLLGTVTVTVSGVMGTEPSWSGLKWQLGIETGGVVFELHSLTRNREKHCKIVDTAISLRLMGMNQWKTKK